MSRTIIGSVETVLSKTIDDVDVDFSLNVLYRVNRGRPAMWVKSTGSWDPPEPPECEVTGATCNGVTFYGGEKFTVPIEGLNIQVKLAGFCCDKWPDEINEACYADAYNRLDGDE